MPELEYHNAGNTEAQELQGLAYLLAQVTQGKAATGVLSGLKVAQTVTASGSVLIDAGGGVVQNATLDGASLLVNDSQRTLDVFTANPMGGVPRNDLIVFDRATLSGTSGGLRAITGVPNASPTDPAIPASAIPLARLRHAASATTIPTAKIDDLRVMTSTAKAGSTPRVMWTAVVGIIPDTVNVPKAVTVSIPDGTFVSVRGAQVTAITTAPGNGVTGVSYQAISPTSITVYGTRQTLTGFNVFVTVFGD